VGPQAAIYEVPVLPWLYDLGRRQGRPLRLDEVPEQEWDSLAALGLDAVWLMGVWERSPAGRAITLSDPALRAEFAAALPGMSDADVAGSPYCVRRYAVDPRLGGRPALLRARSELARRGIALLLDFVPNHTAPDCPWVETHPHVYLPDPSAPGGLARGRDPFFPPWPDVLQVNAFHPDLRRLHTAALLDIAELCDGVRCDMAMLLTSGVFSRTWGLPPAPEYWPEIIPAVKRTHPDFTFLAEVYWNLEEQLLEQGFDYCYDKRLYDRLVHDPAPMIRHYLRHESPPAARTVRFLENHDEPRAAAVFPPERQRCAAVALMTLPGAKLIHDGQLEGRRVKAPVHLRCRAPEPVDDTLYSFWRDLLSVTADPAFRSSEWSLCEVAGWPDNPSCENLLAWQRRAAGRNWLIVINWSRWPSQARVRFAWPELAGECRLADPLQGDVFFRDAGEIAREGLYVELAPWSFHFFECSPRSEW
jgi:1,4-alpha-glucan branching enzyme